MAWVGGIHRISGVWTHRSVFMCPCSSPLKAWENHLRRNRSIVVDLFHGQLKSQVKCKTCGHISARFDPFNFLSLPLPMDSSMHLEITGEAAGGESLITYTFLSNKTLIMCNVVFVVIKLDGSTPVRYGLRLNMDEKYTGLKKQLSELCSLKPEQILLAEVHTSNIKVHWHWLHYRPCFTERFEGLEHFKNRHWLLKEFELLYVVQECKMKFFVLLWAVSVCVSPAVIVTKCNCEVFPQSSLSFFLIVWAFVKPVSSYYKYTQCLICVYNYAMLRLYELGPE